MGNKTSAIFHLHEQLTASTDLTENHPAFTQGGPFPPFRKVDALAAALPKHTFAINGPRWTYSDKDMIVKSLIIFSNMAGCLLPGSGQAGELHASLQSPDGRLSWMLHADNRVTAQDSCDMRDRLLRYFATCGQEKPLSGNLKRGEKTPENG